LHQEWKKVDKGFLLTQTDFGHANSCAIFYTEEMLDFGMGFWKT